MLRNSVFIVGAGVGGMTAALCLARLGLDVHVFEQSDETQSLGAGIQLTPNCTRVLRQLEIDEELSSKATIPEFISFRDWETGHLVARSLTELQSASKNGASYYQVLRSDLLDILKGKVSGYSNVHIHLGVKVEGIFQSEGKVALATSNETQYADFLIGADGVHSKVRSELWGYKNATFTKQVAWRALVPFDEYSLNTSSQTANVWWGPKKHFVHYLVGGKQDQVNCVCVVTKPSWDIESWEIPGSLDELKNDFCGWHEDLQLLLNRVDETSLYKWALYDRPPLKQWGKGLVTLLGDAAHPMLPFMAQGAAMSIEDAAMLSRCLQIGEDITSSLRLYESSRKKRTSLMQHAARHCETVYHATGIKRWVRNRVAGIAGGLLMDWVFNYDPFTVSLD